MNVEELLKREIEIQYDSIYKFAKVTGISRATFTRIFNDERGIHGVSDTTLRKIALALGLSYDALINGEIKGQEYSEEQLAAIRKETENRPNLVLDSHNPLEQDLLTAFRELTYHGQFKVLEYIKDIIDNNRR